MSTSGRPTRVARDLRDAADLAHARQEDQDRAALRPKRLQGRTRDLVFDPRAWIPADIARLDRVGAARALDQRRIAERRAHPRAVERGRHDQKPQVLAQRALRVEREGEAEVGVERALVELVEQNPGDAFERRIVEDLPVNTPSVTTSIRVRFDTRLCRRTRKPTVSPTFSPSVAAMRDAAARAARRRGSSRMRRLSRAQGSSRSASGTRVVLPAPGGATSTARVFEASAERNVGSASSMGKGAAEDVDCASR